MELSCMIEAATLNSVIDTASTNILLETAVPRGEDRKV